MRPEQRVKSAITRVAFAGAAVGTVMAAFSSLHWFAELFSHFRLYYLMVLALLALTFLHQQRWILVAVSVALAVPSAWYVLPYLLPVFTASPTEAAESDLRLTAINLNYRSDDYTGALAYLESGLPDVVVLQEYTPASRDALAPVTSRYPYSAAYPRTDAFGMAIFSRLPLEDVRRLQLGPDDAVNLQDRISPAGRALSLYTVHVHPPVSRERAGFRDVQLQQLADVLARDDGPRLVIGDLNVTPFSPRFTELLSRSGIADARKAQGIHITWPTFPLPIWIPIDHCLSDPGAGVVDVRRGPAVGSDHYPLEVRVRTGE